MEFDTITASVDGRRGTLTLNRPDSLNPLSSHTLREIRISGRSAHSTHDIFDRLGVNAMSEEHVHSRGKDVAVGECVVTRTQNFLHLRLGLSR